VAGDALALVFGAQWNAAIPVVQLMLVMWLVRALRMLVNATMVVEGRQRAMIGFAAIGLLATALAFVASLPFGVRWTTASFAASLIGVAFGGRALAQVSGIDLRGQIAPALRPVGGALVMVAAVTGLRLGPLAELTLLPRLLLSVGAGALVFAGFAWSFDRDNARRAFNILRR